MLLIQISNTFLNPAKLLASARPCGYKFPGLTVHSLCTPVDHGGISLSVPDDWSRVMDKKIVKKSKEMGTAGQSRLKQTKKKGLKR